VCGRLVGQDIGPVNRRRVCFFGVKGASVPFCLDIRVTEVYDN